MERKFNLSEAMANRLISKTEDLIVEATISAEGLQTQFAQKEKEYLEIKQKVDAVYQDIENQKMDLEILVRFKQNGSGSGSVFVHTDRSNAETKIKKVPKYTKNMKWLEATIDILEKENRFLDPLWIFKKIVAENPEAKKILDRNPATKNSYLNNRERDTKVALKRSVNGETSLVQYEKKYGLPRWTDSNGRPKGQYLAGFMQ